MLYIAATLIALLGFTHSVLGERYILIRLFRGDLPTLFGGTEFTRRTLRFAWHFTTVLALGISALLVQIAGSASAQTLANVVGYTLLIAGLLPLVHTRGRHLSWVVLFTAGALCLAWAAP